MLQQLASLADLIVLTQYRNNPRRQSVGALGASAAALAERSACRWVSEADPRAAAELIDAALPPGGVLVICGSFFLAAELLACGGGGDVQLTSPAVHQPIQSSSRSPGTCSKSFVL